MTSKSSLLGLALICAATTAHAAETGCSFEPRIPATRYEINGGEVYDKEKNLTWQRCSLGQQWKEGSGCVGETREVSRAEANKVSGNWRLPTKDELGTLLSSACLKSVNAEAFPGISLQHPNYWSSTETAPGLTWTVNLTSGGEFNAISSSSNAVKLVRSGR